MHSLMLSEFLHLVSTLRNLCSHDHPHTSLMQPKHWMDEFEHFSTISDLVTFYKHPLLPDYLLSVYQGTSSCQDFESWLSLAFSSLMLSKPRNLKVDANIFKIQHNCNYKISKSKTKLQCRKEIQCQNKKYVASTKTKDKTI